METNINYAVVGAFVISLLAAMIFAIVWLSSGFSFEHFKIYQVIMQESVSGLSIDSPVEYNGVNVGAVKSIELNVKNPQIVDVLLNINSTTPITNGTVATLTTRGLTGIAIVSLKDKSEDLKPLVTMPGESYPIIKTAPSFFLRVDTALSELSTNLHEVSISIKSLLDPENQKSIKQILLNMNSITQNFASNNRKLDAILSNAVKATQQFTPLLQSSTNTLRMLESQTMPATYRLITNLDIMTRNLAEITAQVKQNPSILVRGVASKPLGPGESK